MHQTLKHLTKHFYQVYSFVYTRIYIYLFFDLENLVYKCNLEKNFNLYVYKI